MRSLVFILPLLLLSACSFFVAPQDPGGASTSGVPQLKLASNFASIKSNIIVPNCIRCHSVDSKNDGNKILFSTEDQLLTAENDEGKIIIPGNSRESIFLKVMSSDIQVRGDLDIMPPEKDVRAGRSRPVTEEQIKVVAAWIDSLADDGPQPPDVRPTRPAEPPVAGPSPEPSPEPPGLPGDLWGRVQKQVINPKCITCHKVGGKADELILSSQSDVRNGLVDNQPLVIPGRPFESPLFQVLSSDPAVRAGLKKMPTLKAVNTGKVKDVTADDLDLVRAWILSLAPSSSQPPESSPFPNPPTPEEPLLDETPEIARGRYMFNLSGCVHCHTTDAAKPLAGGYKLKTDFGTFFAPNISPDKKTGIGNWSKGQFLNAMRNGISPSGQYYYPAFPYTSYSKMTDEDIFAIRAYMMRFKPIVQANKAHQVGFPYNKRKVLFFWRLLNFAKVPNLNEETFKTAKGVFKPLPNHDEVWNRGAYLVEGAFHCAQCHSPRNNLGGFLKNKWMSGALMPGGKEFAPNLTSDHSTGLGSWNLATWTQFFQEGVTADGDVVGGDMGKIVKVGTSKLTEKDLEAVTAYLQSLSPVTNKTPP